MRCEEIMKRDVKTLSPGDTVQRAAVLMRESNTGFLPVCDQDKKVIGTLTDRDIAIRIVAENLPISSSITTAMTHDIISCRPEDDLHEAERLMVENRKSRLILVDEADKLAGVISLSDIVQLEEEGDRATDTLRGVSSREAATLH
jgi:CBS domain-containing protein